ncbi:MAG TPA: hypothetical protein VL326_26085 [Kofleriaceae bacterium]|jgi:hypothetical protein|nr:hypothetical protein [Kofleriaceae bacterium]
MRWLAVLVLGCTGCVAFSVRAHVDAVSDVERHGVQAGLNVGFGYAGEKSAILASVGADTGTAPTFGVHDTIDYVHMPEHRLGWRAGFGGTVSIIGDPSIVGLRVASLYSLRERSLTYEQEKLGGEWSASLLALSLEASIGAVTRDREPNTPTRLGGSAGIGLELYSLSRIWF